MTNISIAVAQFHPSADRVENRARVAGLIHEAATAGAHLIVLPEYSSFCAPRLGPDFLENAETNDGPFVTAVSDAARTNSIWVIAGLVERSIEKARFSNALVALDPSGNLATTYRKQHLYDAFGARESQWVLPGRAGVPSMITVAGLTVGLQTCYDLRFPEVTRTLVDAGAHAVAVAAQWFDGLAKKHHWETLIAARAIENTVYVAAADQSGPAAVGSSQIVDPLGITLASLDAEPGIAMASASLERVLEIRSTNPVLLQRRYRVEAIS